jgi:uncharacterized protein (DUF1778 family)
VTVETTAVPPPARPARSSRLHFRVPEEQKALLEEAAALSGRSLTDFVLSSARSAANDILADRTRFTLPPDQWDAFAAALERPPRDLPKIAALLSEPSILDPE